MTTKQVILYQQGSNWIMSDNGQTRQLPYYIRTKKQAKKYIEESQVLANPGIICQIEWA